MRSGEPIRIWQSVLWSRKTNREEEPTLSNKTAYILRHACDCQEEGGACSFEKKQKIQQTVHCKVSVYLHSTG